MNKKDLLEKFKPKTKKIEVKGWDDTVEIRELSNAEFTEVQALMIGDTSEKDVVNGKMEVSIRDVERSKFLAVSMSLVNPKLSVKELEGMGVSAKPGIEEIYSEITRFNSPKK